MRHSLLLAAVLCAGVPAAVQTDELQDARSAIERGHPWRATQLVAPLLRNVRTRSPAAVIVAARAAAGWGGWTEVERLLAKEPWVDGQFGGEGRELLARAAFERGADTSALTQSKTALDDAKTADNRAVRLVLLA